MPSLFVSRSLAPASPLRLWASQRGYDLRAESLISFTPLPFVMPADPLPDWVFFYSPKAVEYWYQGLDDSALNATSFPKLAALGPGTAAALLDLDLPVDFCGVGDPTRAADNFLSIAAGQRVLFPRALQSRRAVEKLIREHIQAIDLVVYTNEAAPRTDLPAAEIVILTSPLNVKAYFSSAVINPKATFFTIGATTAAALADYSVQALYPTLPSEAGLVALLQSIPPKL